MIRIAARLLLIVWFVSGCSPAPVPQEPDPIPNPPACDLAQVRCGERCVETQSDPLHCGGCGLACADGDACIAGACVLQCEGGQMPCDGACVDTRTDERHCGGCGEVCGDGLVCVTGRCGCPAGLTRCDGVCVDFASDAENCGGCGTSCLGFPGTSSGTCSAGVCAPVCNVDHADCNGALGDGCEQPIASDRENCGGCGIVCGSLCGEGTCLSVAFPAKTFHHACVLHQDGRASCWGYNEGGQVGDGTTSNVSRPVPVVLPDGSPIAELATGEFHTCARNGAGQVWCWGRNERGQLGTGDTMASPLPVPVYDGLQPLTGVVGLALTDASTCAVSQSGHVRCWGSGQHGRLGNGETEDSLVPVTVREGSGEFGGVVGLAAGNNHVCARMSDGSLWCWGRNNNGQLGLGTSGSGTDVSLPTQVPGLTGVDQVVAAGFRTCVRMGGAAKCWGQNLFGQVGDGTTVQKNAPTDVLGLTQAAHLSIAQNHGCALLLDGRAACWGFNNFGQLGDGTLASSPTPVIVRVPGGMDEWMGLRGISAGGAHTCAADPAHAVHCWGMNNYGQLGDGSTVTSTVPVPVRW